MTLGQSLLLLVLLLMLLPHADLEPPEDLEALEEDGVPREEDPPVPGQELQSEDVSPGLIFLGQSAKPVNW